MIGLLPTRTLQLCGYCVDSAIEFHGTMGNRESRYLDGLYS